MESLNAQFYKLFNHILQVNKIIREYDIKYLKKWNIYMNIIMINQVNKIIREYDIKYLKKWNIYMNIIMINQVLFASVII